MNQATQLGAKSIPSLLAKFAIPSVLSLVLHALYNIVDRAFIGRGVGPLGLAGVTLSFPVMLIIFGLCLLFSSGSSSLVSLYLGENKKEKAEEVLGTVISLITVTAILCTIAGPALSKHILFLFSPSPQALPYAMDYLNIIIAGSFFFFFGFTSTFIIRAEGNPIYATAMIIIATFINLFLDAIFIFGYKMGTEGAALATVISEAFVALMGISYIMRKKGIVHIRRKNLVPKLNHLKRIMTIGSSPAILDIVASLQFGLINQQLAIYGGDNAVAAMGIIFSISTFIHLFTFGMAGGMQPIIGYNYGAKNISRVKQTLKIACSVTFITAIIFVGFIFIFSEPLVHLFIKDNIALVAFTSHSLKIFLCLSPLITLHILCSRYFQAIGKGLQSTVIGLSRQLFIFIPILYIMTHYVKLNGVFLAGPITDFFAAFITLFFIARELKKLNKIIL